MADTTFTVTTDIEAILGKVRTDDIAKKLNSQIQKGLKNVKDVDLSIGVKALPKNLQKEIEQFVAQTDKALDRASSKLKSKQQLTNAIRQELEGATDVVDNQGRILKTRLQKVLEDVARAQGLSQNVTSSRSSLNQFLQLAGKGLVQALQQLEKAELAYEDAAKKVNIEISKKTPLIRQANDALKKSSNESAKAIKKETQLLRENNAERKEGSKRTASQAFGQKQATPVSAVGRLTTSTKEETRVVKEQTEAFKELQRLKASAALGSGKFVKATEKEVASLIKLRDTSATVSKAQAGLLRDNPDLGKAVLGIDKYNSALQRFQVQTKEAVEADRRFVKGKADITTALKGTTKAVRDVSNTTKQAQGPVQELTRNFQDMKQAFRAFIRFAVEYRVLFAVLQGFRDLAAGVVSLQDALVSIETITRSTPKQMELIESSIKSVATTTQFSTNQIAEAAQVLAQAGTEIEKIPSTLSSVAQFAAATNATLATSADLLTSVKNIFTELEIEQIADQLANVVNISKITPEGLNTILSRAAQIGKANNIAADQLLSAVGVLKNVGIKDSTISTGFRRALLELLSPDTRTLKALQKRYAAVGQDLSQEAIRSLFQGFKDEDNPLLAGLDELAKLGFAGSASKEFDRVFNVRAENVLQALVQNRDQLIANENAINTYGTALKGAENQLKSLPKSFANWGAAITVVTSNLTDGLVGGLSSVVRKLTDVTKAVGKAITDFKSLSGSTGGLTSALTGVLAGGSALARGKGIFKSLGIGAGAGVIAEGAAVGSSKAAQSAAGDTVANIVSTIVQGALLAFSAKDLVKGAAGKAASRLSTAKFKGTDKIVQGLSAASKQQAKQFAALNKSGAAANAFIAASTVFTSNISAFFLKIKSLGLLLLNFVKLNPLTALVTTVATVAGSYLFNQFTQDVEARAKAIGQQIQDLNIDAGKIAAQITTEKTTEQEIEKIRIAVQDSEKGVTRFFENIGVKVEGGLKEFVDRLAVSDLDLGSVEFARNIALLESEFGIALNPDQIANLRDTVRDLGKSFKDFEATRVKLFTEIQAGLVSEDPTATQTAISQAFLKLAASEKAVFQSTISTAEEQIAFNNLLDKIIQDRSTGLQKSADALEKQGKSLSAGKLALEVEAAADSGDFSSIVGELNDAIQEGAVERIELLRDELQNQLTAGDIVGSRGGFTFQGPQVQERAAALAAAGLSDQDLAVAVQTARDNSIDKVNAAAEKAVTDLKNSIGTLTKARFDGMGKSIDAFTDQANQAIKAIGSTAVGSDAREQATKDAVEVIRQGTNLQLRVNQRRNILEEKVKVADEKVNELETSRLLLTAQEVTSKQQRLALELAGKKNSAEFLALVRQQNQLQVQFNNQLQERLRASLAAAVELETGEDQLAGLSISETLGFFQSKVGSELLQVEGIGKAFSSLLGAVKESTTLTSQYASEMARAIAGLETLPEVGKALQDVTKVIANLQASASSTTDQQALADITQKLQKARAQQTALTEKQTELQEADIKQQEKKQAADKRKVDAGKKAEKQEAKQQAANRKLTNKVESVDTSFGDLENSLDQLSGSLSSARLAITGDVDAAIGNIKNLSQADLSGGVQGIISEIQSQISSGKLSKSEGLSKLDDVERAARRSQRNEAIRQQAQASQQANLDFQARARQPQIQAAQEAEERRRIFQEQVNRTKSPDFGAEQSVAKAKTLAEIEQEKRAAKGLETQGQDTASQGLDQAATELQTAGQTQEQAAQKLNQAADVLPQSLQGAGDTLKDAASQLISAAGALSSAAASAAASSSSSTNDAAQSRDVAPNSNPVSEAVANQSDKTPVEINVEGAKMQAEASGSNIKQFRKAIGVQNLKQGSRG